MAFNNEWVKALGGGSGVVPSIFTYATNDTQAVIEATNYFVEAVTYLSQGDIIYISYDTTTIPYIVSVSKTSDVNDEPLVNVQKYDLFVGDTRDTDGAGGRVDRFSLAIQGANGLFSTYTYRNNSDTLAVIVASGYFVDAGAFLEVGDVIYAVGIDGFFMLRVLTTGANVTTEEIVFA